VLAGHWHEEAATEDRDLVQLGALVPTGWDNPGLLYGRVMTLDAQSGEIREHRIAGPRFLRMPWSKVNWEDIDNTSGLVFLRVDAKAEEVDEATRALNDALEQGLVAGGSVTVCAEEARAAVQKAATSARSADTLAEAIDRYVAQMPAPESVDREEVKRIVNAYLEAGDARQAP
jgi:hypothetical protein